MHTHHYTSPRDHRNIQAQLMQYDANPNTITSSNTFPHFRHPCLILQHHMEVSWTLGSPYSALDLHQRFCIQHRSMIVMRQRGHQIFFLTLVYLSLSMSHCQSGGISAKVANKTMMQTLADWYDGKDAAKRVDSPYFPGKC